MSFAISYDKQPQHFLKKAEKQIAERIIDKIDILKNGPVPHDAKAIVGYHGVFRIRVGNHRVLYRINYNDKTIVIVKIDKRGKIY